MHKKLVEAVRAGSQVTESIIVSGLTDKAAYRLESRIIGEFHKNRAGQLWNTIDERFMDPRFLPDEWDGAPHAWPALPEPGGRESSAAQRKLYEQSDAALTGVVRGLLGARRDPQRAKAH